MEFRMTISVLAKREAPTHRRIEAARRRATDARRRADNRPTPENLNRAVELEAGLDRMEAEARA